MLAFVLTTLGTSLFPLADFVSDVFVAYEFYTAEDPAKQYWGNISIGLLSFSTFLNLAFFWLFWDVLGGSETWNNQKNASKTTRRTRGSVTWSSHWCLNVLIGFVLTAANLRAQALACLMLWRIVWHNDDVDDLKAKGDGFGDAGAGINVKTLAFVKLFEYFFETIPELLLQGYAVLYLHYVDGTAILGSSNTVLILSVSVSFATLVSGLSMTFLWANDAAVMAIGWVYLLCMMYGRMALIVLLFLQFGKFAAIFVSTSLVIRIVYIVGGAADAATTALFDAPTTLIIPVGKASDTDSRAVTHDAKKEDAGASAVLYGGDALKMLALHIAEAVIGGVMLHTLGARSIAPYVPDYNATADGAGPAEVEMAVPPGDILWYIVYPYCAGLAALALLVVVDRRDVEPSGRIDARIRAF